MDHAYAEHPDGIGLHVEEPTVDQFSAAAGNLQSGGIDFEMGRDNRGEVHFGPLTRDVAVYMYEGQPQLIIFDEEADGGTRGPIVSSQPKEVEAALRDIVVDQYFGERFRLAAGTKGENDPTNVKDTDLKKIVEAFRKTRNALIHLPKFLRRRMRVIPTLRRAHLCCALWRSIPKKRALEQSSSSR